MQSTKSMWNPNTIRYLQGTSSTRRFNDRVSHLNTDLKLLVKDCGYTDPDEMVEDRVVIGCHSTKTREKLIEDGSELTLEKAIDIARTDEMPKAQLKSMATEKPPKTKSSRENLNSGTKIAADVVISMTKKKAQHKEGDIKNAKS